MKKLSRIHMFILALSLACAPVRAVDWERVGLYTCIGGAVAAVTGIIWAIFTPETNDHMLERIQQDYDNTSHFMFYVKAYEDSISVSPHLLGEHKLYNILLMHLKNTDITTLEYRINDALRSLNSGKRELEKRIRENKNPKQLKTIEAMKQLLADISERESRIHMTLKTLFDCHSNYFKAVQYYSGLITQYNHEISILNTYHHDSQQAGFQIKLLVNNNRNLERYPFVYYYDALVLNQQKLQKSIGQLSLAYPEIIHKAQEFLRSLEYIRSVIVGSPEYTRDLFQKEQDTLREAQRQLAIQQEQFRREQENAQYERMIKDINSRLERIALNAECRQECQKLEEKLKILEEERKILEEERKRLEEERKRLEELLNR